MKDLQDEPLPSELLSKLPRFERLGLRLLVAFAMGLFVFCTAFESGADRYMLLEGYPSTQHYVDKIGERAEFYRRIHGHPPRKIADLPSYEDWSGDAWGRPYLLQVNGQEFDVISYGRDGVPGGVGLDADISFQHRHSVNLIALLWQASRNPRSEDPLRAAYWAGASVVLLAFCTLKFPQNKRWTAWFTWCIYLLLYAVVATNVGIFIAMLHLPAGH